MQTEFRENKREKSLLAKSLTYSQEVISNQSNKVSNIQSCVIKNPSISLFPDVPRNQSWQHRLVEGMVLRNRSPYQIR